jgi:hypothetical protein
MPSEATAVNQNPFLDALRAEIVTGSENLNIWIRKVQSQGSIDSLFSLETWLKGVRSFFSLEHIPLTEAEKTELVNRSFLPEIKIVREGIVACESAAGVVMRPAQENRPEFEEFVEAQMRRDRILDIPMSRIVEQPTPDDSLLQLVGSLNDLRVTIDSLRNRPDLNYQVFLSLGRSFRRDLKECRYIDMLISQRFRLQYDLIDNKALSNILHGIAEESPRRNVALALLYLFRFLKYMKLISTDLSHDRPLRRHLAIFSLLHEEMDNLSSFLKARLLRVKDIGRGLKSAAELIAYSLKSESQRVLNQELVFVAGKCDASSIYTRIENSHGLLRNCCQSCIVTLLQAIDKSFDGSLLFPSRAERLVAAGKLRQDLWDLRQWLTDILGNGEALDSTTILEHLTLFRDASLRSLMYRDWAEFESFMDALATSANFIEIRTHVRKFVSFLGALIQEVSKRSIFHERPPDS